LSRAAQLDAAPQSSAWLVMSTTEDTRDFEALLDFLKRNRGFDFTGYKRTTLRRRTEKRMEAVKVTSYAQYLALLEADPAEFTGLFNTLLINVTRFFRDDAPWEFLASHVLPALLARKAPGSPIRVWSAGCASGEEAYSLAMLLAERLGADEFRERVKIYATDVDEEALVVARSATYTERQIQDVPDALRERYFERLDGRFVFTKELRRSVIFGRNDLVQDAPISRIDLLLCRNCLMYFNAPTQAMILARFHFALAEGGVLFLGRAETLLTHSHAFAPIDLKRRLFTKVPRIALRDRLYMAPNGAAAAVEYAPAVPEPPEVRLRDAAFEAGAAAQFVIDRSGRLAVANERARALFGLQSSDVGRMLQDLELSYRPTELRSLIEESNGERRTVLVNDIVWRPRAAKEDRTMNLEIVPLADDEGELFGTSILFADVTEARRLAHELEESRRSLETAYEELQSTNEELETTNEELQSTVEELETTNEELQSTNEELETMNEELQSTNEELQTMNDELRRRSEEFNEVNAFLESVFTSLRGGVAVLDADMRIMVWNDGAEELWGVRASEVVDTHFLSLDIGLPVEKLRSPIRSVLSAQRELAEAVVPAVNRRGRALQCRVECMPLVRKGQGIRGVIVVMDEAVAESAALGEVRASAS
jgi:two-component system CheB/CheR fusion protein